MQEDCKIALHNRGICVIIPTYNNAGTIIDVTRRALSFCADVFVVLDGCTDNTSELLQSIENKPIIVELPKNSGKGNALKTGFKAAIDSGFAYAITLDADGQHFPEDIPLFLEANRQYPEAIIVGKRMGLDMADRDRSSSFANSFSNLWFFLQTLKPLQDTQTGYRLYPLKRLHGLNYITSRYEAELELLVFSAWAGVRIESQDVRVFYPPRCERVSHFRPVYDFARISALNVILCILALTYGLPRTILRAVFSVIKSVFILLFYVLAMLLLVTPGAFLYLKVGRMTEHKKEQLHNFICYLARTGLRLFGLCGNKYTTGGNVAEDFSRPAILLCNHQSHLDLLPMLALTPKLVILTADWVWNNPLYGFIIRQADYLPASDGIEAIAPRLKKLIDKGYSVAVYPEGTRSLDCSKIGRFHQGAFYLAKEFDVDVLPLILYGTGKALPKHGRVLHKWPFLLEIDERIPQDFLFSKGETLKEQSSWMRKYYIGRYKTVADKMEQTLK